MRKGLYKLRQAVATYLDDGLLLAGQALLVTAGNELWDRPWALAIAGGCLIWDAVLVARARQTGGKGK